MASWIVSASAGTSIVPARPGREIVHDATSTIVKVVHADSMTASFR
jgi:hypothetical protein